LSKKGGKQAAHLLSVGGGGFGINTFSLERERVIIGLGRIEEKRNLVQQQGKRK